MTYDESNTTESAPCAQNAPEMPAATAKNGNPKQANRKRGGQAGNQNRVTSGLRGSKLPKDARSEEIKLHSLRAVLRSLAAQNGKQGPEVELIVQTALRHETTALLALRWLRVESPADGDRPAMPIEQRMNLLGMIARATDARNRAIAQLLPAGGPRNDFADLYQRGDA